jgi:hypothetical protein
MQMTRNVLHTLLITALALSTTGAVSRAKPKCSAIHARFETEITTVGCTSPVGLCGSGTITRDPLIAGSHYGTINDLAPSAGMPASEPPSMLSISGERSLTPDRGGTLSAHITGIFDTAQGYFDELNVITGGTGPLAGATGAIHLFGRATGPTTFAGGIRGTICVP